MGFVEGDERVWDGRRGLESGSLGSIFVGWGRGRWRCVDGNCAIEGKKGDREVEAIDRSRFTTRGRKWCVRVER